MMVGKRVAMFLSLGDTAVSASIDECVYTIKFTIVLNM